MTDAIPEDCVPRWALAKINGRRPEIVRQAKDRDPIGSLTHWAKTSTGKGYEYSWAYMWEPIAIHKDGSVTWLAFNDGAKRS